MLNDRPLTAPGFIDRWVNVYDWLDPVAADRRLANDFAAMGRPIQDQSVLNTERPRHPHSATGYLSTDFVRQIVHDTTDSRFGQEIKNFVIANDLSERIEELAAETFQSSCSSAGHFGQPMHTQEVLIELRDVHEADESNQAVLTLDASRQIVLSKLQELGLSIDDTIELNRYVAAALTPEQIERLSIELGGQTVKRIWNDSHKFSLLKTSVNTVHVAPAQRSYQAYGKGIHWAVLDTGIRADHPHFQTANTPTVATQWDCMADRIPRRSLKTDRNGHGTHVAGIIAGGVYGENPASHTQGLLPSNSPLAKIHSYKVLGDDGQGRDSSIIMALDHIAKVNNDSQQLVIHGVNLSLGGTYNPTTYGCGFTPICRELYRLWRQGVVVVVAAGNSGFAVLNSSRGPLQANIDLSIGDPANLEDSIAVGSVHKTSPWSHGVSFFSSRGPTSDGRQKPDVVAPGERIASANHRFETGDLYVELSGTSMAAPHVSGLIASFLSCRREFIGRPDSVKQILLDNCNSIGRNRQHQGAGIPNLVKMLEAT